MALRQLAGWALLANAGIGILLSVDSLIEGGNTPAPITIVNLVAFLLFIVGLPAIQALQPQTGRLGQLGLVLMGLGAGIAFVVVAVYLAGSSISSIVPLSSAITGGLGGVLIGWLTIRAGAFPAWIGWLLLATSVLNFVVGYLSSGTFADIAGFVVGVAMSVPIAGYGWIIVQRTRAAYAGERPVRA
jgi:hypothetical protein